MRRLIAVLVSGSALVAGCSSGSNGQGAHDDMQVADTVTAATPANAPATTGTPPGMVLPMTGNATAATVDPATHIAVIAVDQPPALLLYNLDDLAAAPRTVPLPGRVDQLTSNDKTVLAPVRAPGTLVKVTLPAATTEKVALTGGPVYAAQQGTETLVTLHDSKSVAVLNGNTVTKTIGGFSSADEAFPVGDKAVALDRLRTALFDLDPATGTVGAGLRAGEGATNAAIDRFGRVLVTDTRSGELLVFRPNALIMLQRYPVPGSPYGITYDPQRDLVWVTLTAINQVVSYDVAGGQPVERHRFTTIRQPDSVAVDPSSGRVLVASAAGGGMQVIQP